MPQEIKGCGIDHIKYQSFSTYLKRILKISLITSIPQIVASKSWINRIIKIVVFIISLVGFLYQTMTFLRMYWAYPTVANVYVTTPYEVVQPAVTICNHNRKRRIIMCTPPYESCTYMDAELFCKLWTRFCPNRNLKKAFTGLPFLKEFEDIEYDWDRTYEACHNETMINKCQIKLEEQEISCKKNYKRIPVVDGKGEPNCCYTIESLTGQPNAKDSLYPNTFIIELELNSQPEEYVSLFTPVSIRVKIHDRRIIRNPFTDGYSLEGGTEYNAYVSMQTHELLPSPYDTNCFDYLQKWKLNNGTGPLNHQMCVEFCQLNKLLEMGECIDRKVDYPHEFQLCNASGYRSLTSDIVKYCTLTCPAACYDHFYDVQYEKVGKLDRYCHEEDEWCRSASIKLNIVFKKFRIIRFVYQPKFESVEMFSYIGGYMGMWLGISLVSLFDLFETICYLLFYPIKRIKAKNSKKFRKCSFAVRKNFQVGTAH